MSRSILTLTIPPGIAGVNKIIVYKCPGAGKIFSMQMPGGVPGGMVRVGIERDITILLL